MTIKVAGRFATVGVVLALMTIGSRAEEITAAHFRCGRDDAARRRRDQRFAVSFRGVADQLAAIQTFNDTTLTDTLARSAPGVTVKATFPATNSSQTSATGASTRPRSPARRKGWPSTRTAPASTRRSATSSIGTSSRKCDRQDDDHRRKPDLRPQCPRRRRHCDDEERLHLAGFRSRSRGRLLLARARANSVRQAVRQLFGLCRGHADQRRRLAGRRRVAAHQLLRRRRLQGERV